ncbi:MAG: hypothetical protein RLO81_07160 [Fulvivirga sp.]|uniref:hypothetical protein n=1 Tax=Fulvivirga sp. TaxID=1931237 RepID=UPI0032F04DE6
MTIKVSKDELQLIEQIVDVKQQFYIADHSSEQFVKLSFQSLDRALELDDLVKVKLQTEGFDEKYKPNEVGRICESIIDKLHNILNQ